MRTEVIVQLRIEGLHNWPKADAESIGFLALMHRHIFHIRCTKQVEHDDRQIEIITLKRDIERYAFNYWYSSKYECHQFGDLSCESIAKNLLTHFKLDSCEVLEDGENGAVVYNT